MHFYDKNDWYVHTGTPNPAKRIGLQMGFPGLTAATTGYFVAGYGIPDIPAPPAQVTSMFTNWSAQAATFKRTEGQSSGFGDHKHLISGPLDSFCRTETRVSYYSTLSGTRPANVRAHQPHPATHRFSFSGPQIA